ncbi:MAG: BREX system Lon protease-like protein BrxL [Candidatus Muirbacterium halophilum]|nr:BREX system Lon protease-like protein BrxL [Candidatus Muirbacterium halophilum]MCK9474449.1 BREX system Lon protease-like protein BrxL [Candidatus Muirbacterium halophilum]
MAKLDDKTNEFFNGTVVRKDLVHTVKGNAIVPTYVLEYLLGQYCATDDENSILSGIETVKEILAKHYVNRNESGLIRSKIKEKGRHKVIDKISVNLNDKKDCYEAVFSNLGIKKLLVDSATVKKHQKLLVEGIWCIADIEYYYTEEKDASPWILSSLKPIQLSSFDKDQFLEARKQFTKEEWIDLIIQSLGFNPEMFGMRTKLLQLIRLIPYCERNYNLIELGPKGTGKSHVYSEFSPHGMLVSGGDVTVPKLFVDNKSNKIGLVGYWDVVAFDEFAGKTKNPKRELVDILKNYMANKSFSRGIESMGAEASLVFVGNTQHSVPYMLKNSDLFDELPEKFHDSAFIDRIHFYIPGWEVEIIRGEMFSKGFGFVVDYLAEILKSFRIYDYSDKYTKYYELSTNISIRDKDGINKTFSGLYKILFPNEDASKEEIKELLQVAMEGRKRVKDQLLRFDSTYSDIDFYFIDKDSNEKTNIITLEEEEYPDFYYLKKNEERAKEVDSETLDDKTENKSNQLESQEKTVNIKENQKGISFEGIFGNYISAETKNIKIIDSNLNYIHQLKNLMEFIEMIIENKPLENDINIHIVSVNNNPETKEETQKYFEKIKNVTQQAGILLSWKFENKPDFKENLITFDNGWQLKLDNGLDIFHPYDVNDAFSLENQNQKYRQCKKNKVEISIV